MNRKDLYNAFNEVDDDILERSECMKKRRITTVWIRMGAMAAGLCVVVAGILLWSGNSSYVKNPGTSKNASESVSGLDKDSAKSDGNYGILSGNAEGNAAEDIVGGVTIPQTEFVLSDDTEADMMAFFIYEGRSYVEYERFESDADIVGEYLGTSTGLIDEWTKEEGYVELAGSIAGDFYTVNGYDPSFMLCMKNEDGVISTYINDNGIELALGAELFEERLHLSGNYEKVECQTRYDWYEGTGIINEFPKAKQSVINDFVEAINKAEFMYVDDIALNENEESVYDREIYHMYFRMNNGMTVHLRLYEGGYVRFQGLIPVCVQVDEGVFDELISIMEQ